MDHIIKGELKENMIVSHNKQNKIKGTWILKRSFQSPCNSIILPIFLDFDRINNHVFTSGYNESEGSANKYDLIEGSLKIGDHLQFNLAKGQEAKLVTEISGLQFVYYSLVDDAELIPAKELINRLVRNKWNLGGEILEFKTDSSAINIPNSFDMIEYRNRKPFFGTYTISSFKNSLFLILVTDGKHFETVYRIKKINPFDIVLESVDKKESILKVKS